MPNWTSNILVIDDLLKEEVEQLSLTATDDDLCGFVETSEDTDDYRLCGTRVCEKSDTSISISTQTAWVPLGKDFLRPLSLRYPHATIALTYEEEGSDFCGASVAFAGEVLDRCYKQSALLEEWASEVEGYAEMEEDERYDLRGDIKEDKLWDFLDDLLPEMKGELLTA